MWRTDCRRQERERTGSLLQFSWTKKYGGLDKGPASGGGGEWVDQKYIMENMLLDWMRAGEN